MKYRAQAEQDDDYQFGRSGIFLTNSSAAVAQAIKTRLLLAAGEWFLDTSEGTPYDQVLGTHTQTTRDLVMRERILDTQGVSQLLEYSSSVSADRKFTVKARVQTIYSNESASISLEF